MDRGMVEEKKIVPIFQELIATRREDEDLTYNKLEEIRRKAKDIVR